MGSSIYTRMHDDVKFILDDDAIDKCYLLTDSFLAFELNEKQEEELEEIVSKDDDEYYAEELVLNYLERNNIGYETVGNYLGTDECYYITIDKYEEVEKKYSHYLCDECDEKIQVLDLGYDEVVNAYIYYDGSNYRITCFEEYSTKVEPLDTGDIYLPESKYGYYEVYKTIIDDDNIFDVLHLVFHSYYQDCLPKVVCEAGDIDGIKEYLENN